MKYRKKPVVIEAIQWNGFNVTAIMTFVGEHLQITCENGLNTLPTVDIIIKTLEGDLHCSIGDFIIKGVNGEFYPCKPDIFEKTYELVDPTTDCDGNPVYDNETILELFRIMTELDARDCSSNSVFQEYHGVGWKDLCDKAIKLLEKLKH